MVVKARTKTILKTVGIGAAGLGVLAVVGLNIAAVKFGESLDILFSSDQVEVSRAAYDAQMTQDAKLAQSIEGEGIVLLKNDDQALPLASTTDKVNVFGWAQTDWVSGGSGSGGTQGTIVGIDQALSDAGIQYNSELADMYNSFATKRNKQDVGSLNSYDHDFLQLFEPFVSDERYYTKSLLDNAKSFSDTAIVVLGRRLGESMDASRVQWNVSEAGGAATLTPDRSYLEISPAEEALLRYVGQTYKHTIVVINSTNPMELGFLQDIKGLDAAVLVGATGNEGARTVVDVLTGKTNPSGKTTDTFAYDMKTAASWANSGADGEGLYTNAQDLYPADGTNNANVGTNEPYDAVRFVDYAEGIYVGYRWYETADAEGYWNNVHNRYGTGYAGVVQYPFGYGLSYTTFSWNIIDRSPRRGSTLSADDTISMTVRVTNTGEVAGKDTVELYYSAPYVKGQIEKSAVNLAAFAKTKLLEPGESQDLTLEFSVRDMASYDYNDANNNGFSGYELDPGEYHILLMKDAHTLADTTNADAIYHVEKTILYPTDPITGARVSNKFTGETAEAGVSVDGSNSGADIRYMTRADFARTFPKTRDSDREMTDNVKALNYYTQDRADEQDKALVDTLKDAGISLSETVDELHGASRSSMYALARQGMLTNMGLELGQDYNDPAWDTLLNQLSAKDMEAIILHGYSATGRLDSISKPKNKDLDGPSQIGSFNQLRYGTAFPCASVLAQTWNVDLATAFGEAAGMEAAMLGVDGWYAPGANLHRSPLGGRSYEYYSEDPLISGKMAAHVVQGSLNSGTYVYMKHLLLNEQDSFRDSLYTWLTEQTLRELYLEPFRLAVEEGHATGMMSSYNRIGPIWAGGSKAILTDVLRGEWGFEGTVITDYSDHHVYMNADEMLRAGGDLYMDGVFRDGSFSINTKSEAFAYHLRRATKDILYTWLNARATNINYNEQANDMTGLTPLIRPIKIPGMSPVLVAISLIDAALSLAVIVGAVQFVRRRRRQQSEK